MWTGSGLGAPRHIPRGVCHDGFRIEHGLASPVRPLGAGVVVHTRCSDRGLPIVRILGAGVARLVPSDESFAVTLDSLVGRVATVLGGTARNGYPPRRRC